MLEPVYEVCSRAARGATGGNDFDIRYDESADSLQFNLDSFKRWRKLKKMIEGQVVTPRYHPDFVPGFQHLLEAAAVTALNALLDKVSDNEDITEAAMKEWQASYGVAGADRYNVPRYVGGLDWVIRGV